MCKLFNFLKKKPKTPPPTPTITNTPPPTTPTPTTTPPPTSTSSECYINFYARYAEQSNSSVILYYSVDNIEWQPIAQPITDTCSILEAVTVPTNTTLFLTLRDGSNNPVYYNAQPGVDCPSNSAIYCELGGVYSMNISANTNIGITVCIAGGAPLPC